MTLLIQLLQQRNESPAQQGKNCWERQTGDEKEDVNKPSPLLREERSGNEWNVLERHEKM
jgi:hypothetical protein